MEKFPLLLQVALDWPLAGFRKLVRPLAGLRQLAHKIADFVYEEFTGDSGYFDTQIVYVAESGTQSRRVKRLAPASRVLL